MKTCCNCKYADHTHMNEFCLLCDYNSNWVSAVYITLSCKQNFNINDDDCKHCHLYQKRLTENTNVLTALKTLKTTLNGLTLNVSFSYSKSLTESELKHLETMIDSHIKENLKIIISMED